MKITKEFTDDGKGWFYFIEYENGDITPHTIVLYSVIDGYVSASEDFYLCNDLNELIYLLKTFTLAVRNKKIGINDRNEEYITKESTIEKTFQKYRKNFTEYESLFSDPQSKKAVDSFNDMLNKSKTDLVFGRTFILNLDEFIEFKCLGNIRLVLKDEDIQNCIRTAISVTGNGEFSRYYKNYDSKIKKKVEQLLEDDEIEQYTFQSPKDDDLILYAIREIQDGALVV